MYFISDPRLISLQFNFFCSHYNLENKLIWDQWLTKDGTLKLKHWKETPYRDFDGLEVSRAQATLHFSVVLQCILYMVQSGNVKKNSPPSTSNQQEVKEAFLSYTRPLKCTDECFFLFADMSCHTDDATSILLLTHKFPPIKMQNHLYAGYGANKWPINQCQSQPNPICCFYKPQEFTCL